MHDTSRRISAVCSDTLYVTGILNIPITRSLPALDPESEEAMESCNPVNDFVLPELLYQELHDRSSNATSCSILH